MKRFLFDTLLNEDEICNLTKERKVIQKAIEHHSKLVIYGPRNFGKTSLVKNVIIPKFKSDNKKSFVFFADLMDVKSHESMARRISKNLELSFSQSFPAKTLMDGVKRFLTALRPQVSFDPATGAPSISITSGVHDKPASCEEIFETIRGVAKEVDTLVVLDEFQDITFVSEAESIFRGIFQELKDIPVIVMGSKRHILANIFAKPSAPLSMFGEDLEFKPIPYEEYHEYIMERFCEQKLAMSFEDSKYLQDTALRIPETINIICAEIMERHERMKITVSEINGSLQSAVERRESRYEEYLSHFTENEESVIIAVAKSGCVKHPNGREFLKGLKPTSRMIGIIVKQLMGKSVLDRNDTGYFVTDPLFVHYLKTHR